MLLEVGVSVVEILIEPWTVGDHVQVATSERATTLWHLEIFFPLALKETLPAAETCTDRAIGIPL